MAMAFNFGHAGHAFAGRKTDVAPPGVLYAIRTEVWQGHSTDRILRVARDSFVSVEFLLSGAI